MYSEVASKVKENVAKDAAAGKAEAIALLDSVDRKLVKQTVMTSVYGVTFIGARHQIAARLREKGWTDEALIFQTSSYASYVRTLPQSELARQPCQYGFHKQQLSQALLGMIFLDACCHVIVGRFLLNTGFRQSGLLCNQ